MYRGALYIRTLECTVPSAAGAGRLNAVFPGSGVWLPPPPALIAPNCVQLMLRGPGESRARERRCRDKPGGLHPHLLTPGASQTRYDYLDQLVERLACPARRIGTAHLVLVLGTARPTAISIYTRLASIWPAVELTALFKLRTDLDFGPQPRSRP
ncbi:hypothetical protein BU16DRAFT_393335 [Lophium mytilinum]|uniref:Uncharacterized protein n=1 Tax=Lophium mytilinum TaxID=390894 RepID=A0A6A6QT36_9PEZI|nr:hypothetical protein BU16DRAFT_393335 [Lophium mytilinum]